MGKVFGMLLIVGGIWVGLEFYRNGPQGAFGGSLASAFGEESAQAEHTPTPQRAGGSVDRAHRDTEKRFDRMLGE